MTTAIPSSTRDTLRLVATIAAAITITALAWQWARTDRYLDSEFSGATARLSDTLPDGVTLTNIDPATVTVELRIVCGHDDTLGRRHVTTIDLAANEAITPDGTRTPLDTHLDAACR